MMKRGKNENHFKFLDEEETREILKGPHYFCLSTVSWKDTAKRKVRHVSNPSSVSKASSRSLNMLQKVPSNITNSPLWPLQMFTLFRFPYSSDMLSAFRRLKVEPEHQRYQLVVFFDFTKENWELYPIVTLQLGLIFGAVQSGTFLELGMEQVADKAETTMAEVTIRYLTTCLPQ